MKWLFYSSIGRKLLMSFTGLCFCGFLIVHLAGNLTIYGGMDSFNSYVQHLHSLGIIINVAEFFLLIMACIHVSTGIILYYNNLISRPVKYTKKEFSKSHTIASIAMPYTGLILLLFIFYHLFSLKLADNPDNNVFGVLSNEFASIGTVVIYIFSVLAAAVHISHGFWSAFQTIGINHPKYTPFIKKLSIFLSVTIGLGFSLLPIYIALV